MRRFLGIPLRRRDDEDMDEIRAEFKAMRRKINTMTERLTNAVQNLTNEVAESRGKLNSVLTYLQGVPALVAAAVAQALADANVADDQAADLIDAAREEVSNNVDSVFDAINANPAPEDTGGGNVTLPPEQPQVVIGEGGNEVEQPATEQPATEPEPEPEPEPEQPMPAATGEDFTGVTEGPSEIHTETDTGEGNQ